MRAVEYLTFRRWQIVFGVSPAAANNILPTGMCASEETPPLQPNRRFNQQLAFAICDAILGPLPQDNITRQALNNAQVMGAKAPDQMKNDFFGSFDLMFHPDLDPAKNRKVKTQLCAVWEELEYRVIYGQDVAANLDRVTEEVLNRLDYWSWR